MIRRSGWLILLLLPVILQGLLAVREPIFSPIDEMAHTDYIATVAESGQPPINGRSETKTVLLAIQYGVYPNALPVDMTKRLASPARISYEAEQFPLYYFLAAPLYRLLSAHPYDAILALRFMNVALSAVGLVLLTLLSVKGGGPKLPLAGAVLLTVTLSITPGFALRHSQITNDVLAGVLVSALTLSMISASKSPNRWRYILEGAMLAAAIYTKLTTLGAVPAVAYVWFTRTGTRRADALWGSVPVVATTALWMSWSLPTYRSILPFAGHTVAQVFDPSYYFIRPSDTGSWLALGVSMIRNYWAPYEWIAARRRFDAPTVTAIGASSVLSLAALAVATRAAYGHLRSRGSALVTSDLASAVAWLEIVGFAAGFVVLHVVSRIVFETDLRELYIFMGPLALMAAAALPRLSMRVVLPSLVVLLLLWGLADYGLFIDGICRYCGWPHLISPQHPYG